MLTYVGRFLHKAPRSNQVRNIRVVDIMDFKKFCEGNLKKGVKFNALIEDGPTYRLSVLGLFYLLDSLLYFEKYMSIEKIDVIKYCIQ